MILGLFLGFELLKVDCLLTLAIWSYEHEAEEYIFLNLPFPSNPKENSSIGLGTGFWFFHEILSFHVADFEYNSQNREY